MPGVTLEAEARRLAEEGEDRGKALIELLKFAGTNQIGCFPAEAKRIIDEAYGPEDVDPHGSEATTDPGHVAAAEVSEDGTDMPEKAAEQAREQVVETASATGTQGSRSRPLRLPPWQQVRSTDPPRIAPPLIDGLLRRGHVGVLVAKAKSNKTWGGIGLCVAVATGCDWLGFPCTPGRVLFIDPEMDTRSLDRRFKNVADAMGADRAAVDAGVLKWTLRGATVRDGCAVRAPSIADVAHDLEALTTDGDLRRGDLALVIIDSCSAMLAGGDENASGDVRAFFNTCLRVAEITGAAVLCVHHEGKAASGDRDGMDRGRGSSAWADCPDLVLSLVEVFPPSGEAADYLADGGRAFCLEVAAIREFPPVEPKRLIWRWPLLVPDEDGITDGWKPKSSQQAAGKASGESRKAKAQERANACTCALLAHMYRNDTDSAEGIPASEAAKICTDALGSKIKAQTLKEYVEQSEWLDVYQRSPQRWAVVPRHPRP